MGTSNLAAYLVLLLVTSAVADLIEDYDFRYTDFFPELSIQPSGLDTIADADSDEKQELPFVDYKAVPILATVPDDLLLRSSAAPLLAQRTNKRVADRRLKQTTVVKNRGGVPLHDSDFDIKSDVVITPVVNWVRTAEQSTRSVASSNRVFDFRWNDLMKKTNKIPQQSVTDYD